MNVPWTSITNGITVTFMFHGFSIIINIIIIPSFMSFSLKR